MRALRVCCVLMVLTLPDSAAAQVDVEVGGYGQFQFNTTSIDEAILADDIASSTFETRRIRPTVEVTIDGWISGVLQPDFAMGDIALKDAFMNLALSDALELRFGQFKKPFSRLELTSSTKVLPIERGVRIRGLEDVLGRTSGAPVLTPGPERFSAVLDGEPLVGEQYDLLDKLGYLGRDIGAAAHGELGAFTYEVGVFNGTGADSRDDGDGKSFAARLGVRPSGGLPLELSAAASHRELGDDDAGEAEIAGTAFEVSAEWGAFREAGLHVLGEVTAGENLALDETFLGAQTWVAYFHPTGCCRVQGIEPVFRASFGDPSRDREDDSGWLLTPGVNVYFHGRNRLMLNWDFFSPAGDLLDSASALRAQAQLHF